MYDRYLTFDGTRCDEMGLRMVGGEPYQPAPHKGGFVGTVGGSGAVNYSELTTGKAEYSPQGGEWAEFMAVPDPYTESAREDTMRDAVRALHGKTVTIVDSMHPDYEMECVCSCSVVESGVHRLLRVEWERGPIRRMDDGLIEVEDIVWPQTDFDPEDAALMDDRVHQTDTTRAGWNYALVEERPTQDTVELSAAPSWWPRDATHEPSWRYALAESRPTRREQRLPNVFWKDLGGSVTAWVGAFSIDAGDSVIPCGNGIATIGGPWGTWYRADPTRFTIVLPGGGLFSSETVETIDIDTYEALVQYCAARYGEDCAYYQLAAADNYVTIAEPSTYVAAEYGDDDFDYVGWYQYEDGVGMQTVYKPRTALMPVEAHTAGDGWHDDGDGYYVRWDSAGAGAYTLKLTCAHLGASGVKDVTIASGQAELTSWEYDPDETASQNVPLQGVLTLALECDTPTNLNVSVKYRVGPDGEAEAVWAEGTVYRSTADLTPVPSALSLTFVPWLFFGPLTFGDADFDYVGYYKYVDGDGMDELKNAYFSKPTSTIHYNSANNFSVVNFADDGSGWTADVVAVTLQYPTASGTVTVPVAPRNDASSWRGFYVDESGVHMRVSGDWRLRDVTGIFDYSADRAWDDGLIFTAAAVQEIPEATVEALGHAPTYVRGLFYGTYTAYDEDFDVDNDSGYPACIDVVSTHSATVSKDGRAVAVSGGPATVQTDLVMWEGNNTVNVVIPYEPVEDDEGNIVAESLTLTWKRGDV